MKNIQIYLKMNKNLISLKTALFSIIFIVFFVSNESYSQYTEKIKKIYIPSVEKYQGSGESNKDQVTIINFSLSKPGYVNIKIYNEFGKTVDELAKSTFGEGEHRVKWNSGIFPQGTYYYSVVTSEFSEIKKIKIK